MYLSENITRGGGGDLFLVYTQICVKLNHIHYYDHLVMTNNIRFLI